MIHQMHEHVPLIDRIEKEEVVVTDTELANRLISMSYPHC
jgi:hypothetical protein